MCKTHVWSQHRSRSLERYLYIGQTCLVCGVRGDKNDETGEYEPVCFEGPKPLACLKASNPSDPRCELTARSFNILMNAGLKSRDEVKRHIMNGKLSTKKTRNLGKLTLQELIHWSGADTELAGRSGVQTNLERFSYELEIC